MSHKKPEAVAIMTMERDGRTLGRAVIPTNSQSQCNALINALHSVADLRAIPARRVPDVFGKLVWLECYEPGTE